MIAWTPNKLSLFLWTSAALWPACGDSRERPGFATGTEAGSAGETSPAAHGGRSVGGASVSGASQAAGVAGRSGAGNGGEGAGSNDAGAHGADAGATGEAGSGDGPTQQPICSRSAVWSDGERLDVSSTTLARFASMTPDERVLAWTSVEGASVSLHVARRESADEPFGAPLSQPLVSAQDRVALGSDGMRVVFVNDDRRGFSVLRREALDQPFDIAETGEFSLLNGTDAGLASQESYGDPVLSPDERVFVYSRFGGGRKRTLFMANRFSPFAPWGFGFELAIPEALEAEASARVQPTALSADQLTLFVWQDSSATELALTRAPSAEIFDQFVSLGPFFGAMPNSDCTRLYYGSSQSPDVFVSEPR